MVENEKRIDKRFESVPVDERQYLDFSGFFDLVYKEHGKTVATFGGTAFAEKLNVLFGMTGCRMWYCLHDKDTYEGQLKVAHVHFVLRFHRKRRWSTTFKDICDAFGVPCKIQGMTDDGELVYEEDGKPKMVYNPWLTISPCISIVGAIRYLIHADDKQKTQYGFGCIITNDVAMAKMCMLCKDGALTSDVLTDLVWASHGNVRLICNLMGLDYFTKYNQAIKMLISQYRYENDGIADRCECKEPDFMKGVA